MRKATAILLLALAYVGLAPAGDVTFQVNMKIKMQKGVFLKDSSDVVRVAGGFNGWGNSTDTLTDPNNDSIYTKTITVADGAIEYKFLKTLRGGLDWENVSNRAYTVTSGSQTIPPVYFDNDSVLVAVKAPVTFQVKMNIKMREGTFQPGSGDIVRVAGGFNGWGSSTDTLTDGNSDSIYTKIIQLDEGATLSYKFLKTLRGGSDWEGDPNRSYVVPNGGGVIPAEYFDRDSVYTPPVSAPVTFQVNMKMKLMEGTFRPDLGDFCTIRGNINGWGDPPGANIDTLKDADNDSIYTRTMTSTENYVVKYKYWKSNRGGIDYESGSDYSYTVPTGGGTVPLRWFDNDSIYNGPVTANILWRVDMNAYLTLGWFRPDMNDSVEARGGFDGWGGTKMTVAPGQPGKYQWVQSAYSGTAGDVIYHKFFLDLDSATAIQRFPDYIHSGTAPASNRDSYCYDHPASTGEGNRTFVVTQSGNLQVPRPYFCDINPQGLLDAQDSVVLTQQVNTAAAKAYADPFVPGVDTLFLVFPDQMLMWRSQLTKNLGTTFPSQHLMSPVPGDPGDTLYQATFKVKGPLHYNMLYFYRYKAPGVGGRVVDQTGGLGVAYPLNSRYIQPLGPNTFPLTYATPTDQWKKQAPFPAEIAPFVTDVHPLEGDGIPMVYSLEQNYPNPFNPSTRIKYSIPEEARVTLTVYNLLGQRVATLVNETQRAGSYIAVFEGPSLATGIYFYRLEAGNFTQVRKMILMK